jgi:hypothetical protein
LDVFETIQNPFCFQMENGALFCAYSAGVLMKFLSLAALKFHDLDVNWWGGGVARDLGKAWDQEPVTRFSISGLGNLEGVSTSPLHSRYIQTLEHVYFIYIYMVLKKNIYYLIAMTYFGILGTATKPLAVMKGHWFPRGWHAPRFFHDGIVPMFLS